MPTSKVMKPTFRDSKVIDLQISEYQFDLDIICGWH